MPASRRVLRRVSQRRARAARAHGAQLEPAVVQHVERDLVALADFTQQVVRRHARILQDHCRSRRAVQAHLVFFLAGADARKRAFDDEGGEEGAVNLGEHDEEVGKAAARDPEFLAGQRPAAVRQSRGFRARGQRIRTGAGFAQAVGAERLAAGDARQVLLLLRVRAKAEDRDDREARLRPERRGETGGVADRVAHDDGGGFVQAHTAVFLRRIRANQPERTGASDQPARHVPILVVQLRQCRNDFVRDKFRGRLLDQPVLVGEPLGREDLARDRVADEPFNSMSAHSKSPSRSSRASPTSFVLPSNR